jgi:hypothetical protein
MLIDARPLTLGLSSPHHIRGKPTRHQWRWKRSGWADSAQPGCSKRRGWAGHDGSGRSGCGDGTGRGGSSVTAWKRTPAVGAPTTGATPLYSGCSDLIWKAPDLTSVQSHPWLPEFEGRVGGGPDGRGGTGGAKEVPADRLPPTVEAGEEARGEPQSCFWRSWRSAREDGGQGSGHRGVSKKSREREVERVGDFSFALVTHEEDGRLIRKHPASATTDTRGHSTLVNSKSNKEVLAPSMLRIQRPEK